MNKDDNTKHTIRREVNPPDSQDQVHNYDHDHDSGPGHEHELEREQGQGQVPTISPGFNKKRQLLLMLPLLILPFITLAFWALGGGQGPEAGGGQAGGTRLEALQGSGINSVVPGAKNTDRLEDKMSQYAHADRLAASRKEVYGEGRVPDYFNDSGIQRDTYGHPGFSYNRLNGNQAKNGRGVGTETETGIGTGTRPGLGNNDEKLLAPDMDTDTQEDPVSRKVQQKLADLELVIDQAGAAPGSAVGGPFLPAIDPATYGLQPGETPVPTTSAQLGALQGLNELILEASGSKDTQDADSETRQINKMLDKILAIQKMGQNTPERPNVLNGLAVLNGQMSGKQAMQSDGAMKTEPGYAVYPANAEKEGGEVPLLEPALKYGGTEAASGPVPFPPVPPEPFINMDTNRKDSRAAMQEFKSKMATSVALGNELNSNSYSSLNPNSNPVGTSVVAYPGIDNGLDPNGSGNEPKAEGAKGAADADPYKGFALGPGFYDIDGEEGRSSASRSRNDSRSGMDINMTESSHRGAGLSAKNRATMAAVIAETQTLVSGAAVKMRLKADINVHGTLIPKGTFVYGASTLNGERLKISVDHIRYLDQLFDVQLKVFDLDGMEGIRIPGSISRDAAKQGADRALQGVGMMSLDPSVSAQAATAGIEAAKGLLRKKVKLVRVTVKAGYPILLLQGN